MRTIEQALWFLLITLDFSVRSLGHGGACDKLENTFPICLKGVSASPVLPKLSGFQENP